MIDVTHDPARRSWVASADGHADFPIQNLPLGLFDREGEARPGVAIGDQILDLKAAAEHGLYTGLAAEAVARGGGEGRLNGLLSLGAPARLALRAQTSALLDVGAAETAGLRRAVEACLVAADGVAMLTPTRIGDYTDFYAGLNHARNVGRLFRPDNPLPVNYRAVPIGYHGRANTVRVSGTPVRRPSGQIRPDPEGAPIYAPTRALDFELELAIWLAGGDGSAEPVPMADAGAQIAGFGLLNDWSARDVQAWEYVPLGPFLAKNFHTTVSPWIVTPEALAPFRAAQPPRAPEDPKPLDYLHDALDQARGALAVELRVELSTERMRAAGMAPVLLSRGSTLDLYWTPAQMVAHHTSGGCPLAAGDLFGSGTISGPTPESLGSLIELTAGGRQPVRLPTGEQRTYLLAGDEVVFGAHARRDGFVGIGFGACVGRVVDPPG